MAADEMPRQADARDRQPQPPRQQHVKQAKRNGIARPPVEHAVQVTVVRFVVILFVALETEFAEKVVVDFSQHGVRAPVAVNAFAQRVRVAVQQRLICLHVDFGKLRLRQQPRGGFHIEFLAVIQAEGEKAVVTGLFVHVPEDFLDTPSQQRVVAQGIGSQPFARGVAFSQNLLAHRLINLRVLVAQKIEQRGAAAFRRRRFRITILDF